MFFARNIALWCSYYKIIGKHLYDKINFCETVFFIRYNNFEKYITFHTFSDEINK